MCKSNMQSDEIVDMISSVVRKKLQVQDNLRVEVLLESTHKWLYRKLKEEHHNRKRKREYFLTDVCKRSRQDDQNPPLKNEADNSVDDDLDIHLLLVAKPRGVGDFG